MVHFSFTRDLLRFSFFFFGLFEEPLVIMDFIRSLGRLGPAVHTAPEDFKNATIPPVVLYCCLRKPQPGKSRGSLDPIVFEKVRFKMFSVHAKTQSRRFQIPPV